MTVRRALILGEHPIAADLIRQYEALGYEVKRSSDASASSVDLAAIDELVLLPFGDEPDAVRADYECLALLIELAAGMEPSGKRLRCHVLLRAQATLQKLRAADFCESVSQRIDLYPFTMEDVWSRSIELDYEPVTLQSEKRVHLVVFGMSEIGEMVAINAAHRAHYPNYVLNHRLRTRITVVDEDAARGQERWTSRYQHLLDNSYHRTVVPAAPQPVKAFHKPMYEGQRDEFVDVEWEFVEAKSHETGLREKLQLWAADTRQLLTVVLAHDDEKQNVSEAMLLPDVLFQNEIPVYVYTRDGLASGLGTNLRPFGMMSCGYDVTLPLVRMAKNINYIYDRCYADNVERWDGRLHYSVEIDAGERERSWAKLKNVKRMSNIFNAMSIPSKMRSIGLEAGDWDKFYDISQQDLELLAQVEHNRWCVEELIMGWRPCTPEEQRAIESDISLKEAFKKRKIHYDLRAYDDLRPDKTGKSSKIYDVCISGSLPLIAKAFAEEEGGLP